jgi:tRNA dimethylallyltransferase
MKQSPKAVVISGPTASGKSRVGVSVSLALGGEIINADSMQVYRGMDVGTAKPTPREQKGVPHHLLDVVEPDEAFNAAMYRDMALPIVKDIALRGKVCIVVGGTGLYIKSLVRGLFPCPPPGLRIRESLGRESERSGSQRLHERLKRVDPEAASKIHPNDTFRIIRALEIQLLTNRRFSDLTREHGFRGRPLETLKICLETERSQLYDRINQRSIRMVETGLVEETEVLLRKGFSPHLKPMKAIGYRHMAQFLLGNWSLQEAVGRLQRDTRRYAKRQLTWLRGDPENIWIGAHDTESALKKIQAFLQAG